VTRVSHGSAEPRTAPFWLSLLSAVVTLLGGAFRPPPLGVMERDHLVGRDRVGGVRGDVDVGGISHERRFCQSERVLVDLIGAVDVIRHGESARPPRDPAVFVRTTSDVAITVGHSVDPAGWQASLDEVMARIAGRFMRVEPRRTARAFLLGLLSQVERKELLVDGRTRGATAVHRRCNGYCASRYGTPTRSATMCAAWSPRRSGLIRDQHRVRLTQMLDHVVT
jgi:hypothetical protein